MICKALEIRQNVRVNQLLADFRFYCRPLQIVLVDFKKVATKSAKKLLKSFKEIGKVATEFQKVY